MFEKNIKLLKKIQPNLAKKLLDYKTEDYYALIRNKEHKEIIIRKDSKNRYISKYNPERDARKAISDMDLDFNSGIYILLGLEFGYKLEALFDNISEKMIIIILERDFNVLKFNLENKDYTKFLESKKVYFVAGDFNDEDYKAEFQNILYKNLYLTDNIFISLYTSSFSDDIKFFKQNVNYVKKEKTLFSFKLGNCSDDTLMGLRNRMNNINRFIEKPGVDSFLDKYKDIYKNKPAVIVASGPSLEKNIKYLKEYQDKVLILACDGSYKRLKKEGIKAHAIGSIERIIKTYEAFYENNEFDNDLILLSPAIVRPEIIDMFDNRFISFYKGELHGLWLNEIDNKGKFINGASVAHLLFGFAYKMECNPIILIGQDLAYSKDGASHATEVSVIEHKKEYEYDLYLKDYEGNNIGSTVVWKMFKEMYEEYIQLVKSDVIDATEGGAYIEGTIVRPLKETLEEYCNEKITPLYKLYKDLNYENSNIMDIKKKCIREIYAQYEYGLNINNVINEYIKNIKKSLNILESSNYTNIELDKIYDVVFDIDEKIVKKIIKNKVYYLMIIYHINVAARKISDLKAKEYTEEILIENLKIQKELLEKAKLYINKAIRVFYIGLKNFSENIDFNDIDLDIDMQKIKNEINYILENNKYYLPED